MPFLQKLPSFFLRHKVIHFLCKARLVSNPFVAIFNNGAQAYVDLSDPEPRNVLLKRIFDPDFFPVARTMLPLDGVCFDLGANVGLCSFGLQPTHGEAHYHLFEANSRLNELLRKSFTLYPGASFRLNQACVTDKPGCTRFHLETTQSGQSHVATESETGEPVPNLILDEYCHEQALPLGHFAKMDLEGHELAALRGWDQHLKAHKIRALYLEVIPENQARYDLPTNAALRFLEERGYRLFLCKEQDFGLFGESPSALESLGGTIPAAHFHADDYPEDHATDALALASGA